MLYTIFSQYAKKNPNKMAIVTETGSVTYAELDSKIINVAKNLISVGVKQGQVLLISLDQPVEYLAVYYASARLGVTVVPLSTSSSDGDIRDFCIECTPDYYLVKLDNLNKYENISNYLSHGQVISEGTLPHDYASVFSHRAEQVIDLPNTEFEHEDLVIHYNTANSPEDPDKFKGSVQTQHSHVTRILNLSKTLNLSEADKTLCIHPLTHAFGSEMFAIPALSTGQTLFILDPKTISAEKVITSLQENSISIFGALPWLYKDMLDLPLSTKYLLSFLRVAICATAPLTSDLANQLYQRFRIKLNNAYGLTETSLITINLCENDSSCLTSIGSEICGVDIRLIDCGVAIADAGELLVRSDGFADRYYCGSLQPLKRDSWIHTGDLVRRDSYGGLHVLGRVSQVISVDGGSVLPLEIENSLELNPLVKEVAVVPLEVDLVIVPVAFVVTEHSLNIKDLQASLLEVLPLHKIPRHIVLRDSLPKSSTGKVSKAKLVLEATELC